MRADLREVIKRFQTLGLPLVEGAVTYKIMTPELREFLHMHEAFSNWGDIPDGVVIGIIDADLNNRYHWTQADQVLQVLDGTYALCTLRKESRSIRPCKQVMLPNSLVHIGQRCFVGFSLLPNITLPNSITTIELMAFISCKGLTKVTLPRS